MVLLKKSQTGVAARTDTVVNAKRVCKQNGYALSGI